MTETRCWKAYQTPVGIEYRTMPDPGGRQIELGRDAIAGGCDGGTLTGQGAAVASALGLTAIALAAVASRRIGSAPVTAITQAARAGLVMRRTIAAASPIRATTNSPPDTRSPMYV